DRFAARNGLRLAVRQVVPALLAVASDNRPLAVDCVFGTNTAGAGDGEHLLANHFRAAVDFRFHPQTAKVTQAAVAAPAGEELLGDRAVQLGVANLTGVVQRELWPPSSGGRHWRLGRLWLGWFFLR